MVEKIGRYEIVRSLGKGGMGEVFLARDPACGRLVAVKKIRPDLAQHKSIQERFLKEAKIAAQLTHPSIIPIYTIDEENCFYTMPYVEGETLKEILRIVYKQQKSGKITHPIGSSILALVRVFWSVCQAIAYSHSKGILHRDLKPENIIVGKYGEVMLLDWGLADFIFGQQEELTLPSLSNGNLTHPGKIPGTIAYMAPERAHGEKSSVLTDIYALGVILYYLLTLHLPFERTTLKEFRKEMKEEKLIDPTEIAPYRDIPLQLSEIAKKCLAQDKTGRYQKMSELTSELENFIEGRPEWLTAARLNIDKKEDWEFQENILMAKHIAITRSPDVMEWVNLMICKNSFAGNIKIQTKVRLLEGGQGVGILLGIPEAQERIGFGDGYSLWISEKDLAMTKLIRSHVELMSIPESGLEKEKWYNVRIEMVENHLRFYLDDLLQCHYISQLPLTGTHVGLLFRDADFEMQELEIFVGSQNVMINCLAIPDAFLANKLYKKALIEYRRIGYSFPGRAEGREALFRAGITLLEQGINETKKLTKQRLWLAALEEFGKLRPTPGAPLEYLGKSLVYKAWQETDEEIKCLELAIRKYPHHPLLFILIEEIVFRLHESSLYNRYAAYQLALLALRHLPQIFHSPDNAKLLTSLQTHREPLFFLERPLEKPQESEKNTAMAIELAFWLAKPITLIEIIEQSTTSPLLVGNALSALLQLGCTKAVQECLSFVKVEESLFSLALLAHKQPTKALALFFAKAKHPYTFAELRALFSILMTLLDKGKPGQILHYVNAISDSPELDSLLLRALLLSAFWEEAKQIFEKYPIEELSQESSPLYYLFGCWLWATEGETIGRAHFSGVSELTTPPTSALLAHYVNGKINLKKGWIEKAFYWEKIELLRQLVLFYQCQSRGKEAARMQKRLNKELKHVSSLYTSP